MANGTRLLSEAIRANVDHAMAMEVKGAAQCEKRSSGRHDWQSRHSLFRPFTYNVCRLCGAHEPFKYGETL